MGEFSLVILQRFHDHSRDFRLAQVKGTGADAVEQAIHNHKSPTVGCGLWEGAALGETAMQAPSDEDRMLCVIKVRKAPLVERHNW